LYEAHNANVEEVERLLQSQHLRTNQSSTDNLNSRISQVSNNVSRLIEGYVQEARLSRWAAEFNSEIVQPLAKSAQGRLEEHLFGKNTRFYAKFLELRPYSFCFISH
jgi:hypothetical protein